MWIQTLSLHKVSAERLCNEWVIDEKEDMIKNTVEHFQSLVHS